MGPLQPRRVAPQRYLKTSVFLSAVASACTSAQLAHSASLSSHSSAPPRRISPPYRLFLIDLSVDSTRDPSCTTSSGTQLKPKELDVISHPHSRESSAQTSPLSIGTSSHSSGDSSASHLKTLLNKRTSELDSLQASSSKHDEWFGAQLRSSSSWKISMAKSQGGTAVCEHFVAGYDIDSDRPDSASVRTKPSPRLPNSKSGQET